MEDKDIGQLWTLCESKGANLSQLKGSFISLAATISRPSTTESLKQEDGDKSAQHIPAERSLEGARKLFRTLAGLADNLLGVSTGPSKSPCSNMESSPMSRGQPAQSESRATTTMTPSPSQVGHLTNLIQPPRTEAQPLDEADPTPPSLGPSTLRRYPKYLADPRLWTLSACYTYQSGHWYCKHPRCVHQRRQAERASAAATAPGSATGRKRLFGVYAAGEAAASSIMRRAREHTLKHEREDLDFARKKGGAVVIVPETETEGELELDRDESRREEEREREAKRRRKSLVVEEKEVKMTDVVEVVFVENDAPRFSPPPPTLVTSPVPVSPQPSESSSGSSARLTFERVTPAKPLYRYHSMEDMTNSHSYPHTYKLSDSRRCCSAE
ncbi:hypothetical protein T439DRAFT_325391 [Meredithblackwellia eburnea MCA 4105]